LREKDLPLKRKLRDKALPFCTPKSSPLSGCFLIVFENVEFKKWLALIF
jgi:hypothetical protein